MQDSNDLEKLLQGRVTESMILRVGRSKFGRNLWLLSYPGKIQKSLSYVYRPDEKIMERDGFVPGQSFSAPGFVEAFLSYVKLIMAPDFILDEKKVEASKKHIRIEAEVLEDGVMEGRKTFANMNKYLKMAISGNFGNMLSVVIASLLLPFLPLKPVHILVQNILNDFAQLGMPFDNVEPEYVEKPKKWNVTGIRKFMVYFGLLSTVLDVLCFGVLWFVFRYDDPSVAEFFQCGWFMFGVISQTMVIHTIRTHKIPFIGANASLQLYVSNIAVVIITLVIGMTDISGIFDMGKVPGIYGLWMLLLLLIYLIMAQIMKKIYIKVNKEWI